MKEATGPVEAIGAQAEVLAYRGGRLAVGAVPGAGKTHVLTELLGELALAPDAPARPHQCLVLTYMRSAVSEFRRRAHLALARRGASAHGLSVSTLHAFAARVLREAEGGEDEAGGSVLRIWSEAEQQAELSSALAQVLARGVVALPQLEEVFGPWEGELGSRRKSGQEVAMEVASKALEQLRRLRQSPEAHRKALGGVAPGLADWLEAYEAERRRWRALDYDGLVAAATDRLESDEALRRRLQRKHRLIIEDEAQDATPLQSALVERLVDPRWGGSGHWVRVGDPNQAIMGFAGSDASGFRAWVEEAGQLGRRVAMTQAGRCAPPILEVANAMVRACRAHPDPRLAGALDAFACIEPVPSGPRANPSPWAPPSLRVHPSPEAEVEAVLAEVRDFLQAHPEATAAILVRSNQELERYREAARHHHLPLSEGQAVGPKHRACLRAVAAALRCLALPLPDQGGLMGPLQDLARALAQWDGVPAPPPLWPGVLELLGQAPPYRQRPAELGPEAHDAAITVAEALAPHWRHRHRPPDELAPALAFSLTGEAEAAWWVGQALVEARQVELREAREARLNAVGPAPAWALDPRWRLAELLEAQALGSKREPVGSEDPGPTPGLILRTMHRAKGAEFDGVWLVGMVDPKDEVFPWEARKMWAARPLLLKLQAALKGLPFEGEAAAELSRVQALAEVWRLVYVGLTRAKRELHVSGHHPASVPPLGPHRQAMAQACGGPP